jgi:hypothetical protein
MSDPQLEKRIDELERDVAALRTKLAELSDHTPWWERIAGSFHNDLVYQEAMKLGREYRQSQRDGLPGNTDE